MVLSYWVTEESLPKGLSLKEWSGLRESNMRIEVPWR